MVELELSYRSTEAKRGHLRMFVCTDEEEGVSKRLTVELSHVAPIVLVAVTPPR